MNAKQLIAAVVVLAAAGTAFAGEITPFDANDKFVSTKTRAEVMAELEQAYAKGELTHGEAYPATAVVQSTRTRAEVRAEAIQAAKIQTTSHFGA